MKTFTYHVEDGQFSFEFEAPLLFERGQKFNVYDFLKNGDSFEQESINEVTVHTIDFENRIVECTGTVS
jgi:hypothetical protein